MTNEPAARPKTHARQNGVRPELRRVEASGASWWAATPSVFAICASAAYFPFRALATIADLAVSLVFLSVVGTVAAWWLGYIPDATVARYAGALGARIISIAQHAGLL